MGAMTNDAGGHRPSGGPAPGVPPAYPPPGYGYPPPGYGPPGYGPPAYGAPGYPPPGYGPPPALKPGIVPLRPLVLADIFNGAIASMRANPKATLGLTTIVVVVTQLLGLALSVWPLAFSESLESDADAGSLIATSGANLASIASSAAASVATGLSTILLSGLLTVVIGRSVFGAGISIGEAWQRLRPRLWALIGFAVLTLLATLLALGAFVVVVAVVAQAANGWAALSVGLPLGLVTLGLIVYVAVMITFAPVVIVLERRDVISSIRRSFTLVKGDFWRVFGIRLLAMVVAQIVAVAVSIPFTFGGQLLFSTTVSATAAMVALVLIAVGSAVGQIITGPFNAGVVVLQYADRRIRSEAFDLVLQTGAAVDPAARPDSTDDLWLTGRR
ncbi:hypothetical protein [Mycobacterium sp. SMC-4]|uniref:DUF7847 domain-containing protein n=1 Tax=Mycobacterium sp. SMC-4 TaxID=2857059 RepID=UPI003CFE2D9E